MKRLLKYVFKFCKENFVLLILIGVLELILSLFSLLTPYLEASLVNELSIGRSMKTFTDILIVFLGIQLLGVLFFYLVGLLSAKLNLAISYKMIEEKVEGLEKSKIKGVQKYEMGMLANRISTDVNIVLNFVLGNIFTFCMQGGILVFVLRTIHYKAPEIFLFVLASTFLNIVSYIFYRKRIYKANSILREKQDHYFYVYLKRMESIFLIKVNSLFKWARKNMKIHFLELERFQLKEVGISLEYQSLRSVIQSSVQVAIFLYIGVKIFNKKLLLGDMILVETYVSMIFSGVQYYVNLLGEYQTALVSMERLDELDRIEKDYFGNEKIAELQTVEAKKISYAHDPDKGPIFELGDIALKRGEITLLYGKNGKGKSTFIYYLLGIFSNQLSDNVLYNGKSLTELEIEDFRKKHTFTVLQHPEFYAQNPKELICQYIELEDFNKKMSLGEFPFRINEILEKDFNEMSLGQRQKWAIIEACISDRTMLFFDEPTSSLDVESVNNFIQWINLYKDNKIIIIASHDQKVVESVDKVIYF